MVFRAVLPGRRIDLAAIALKEMIDRAWRQIVGSLKLHMLQDM